MTPGTQQNLDRSLVQGIAWTGAIRWITQMLSWTATFLVARLLTPTDYGLVGMAMIYIGLAQIVSEGGVSAAIVQHRELGEQAVAELNGLAIMIGVALFALTLAMAAPIAWFFEEPQVYPVVCALSVVFLIRGVQVVPRALLARDLNFRQLAWVDGLETFALMVVTVGLAIAKFGYWSLALGGIASSVFTTIVSLKWRPHRIVFPRTVAGLRQQVQFAWQVVTSQLAWYAYSNADFAVVGRVLGKAILGAYSFAWTIASIPVDRVSGMVSRVTPAFFAAVQHDPPQLRRYLLNLTEGLAVVTLPACIGLAVVAPDFVRVALGDAWIGAIVPLRLLSLYAAFRSIITPAPQILIATGYSRQSMYFSLLAAVILPPTFYLGAKLGGAPGVAMGWFLVYPLIAIGLFLRYAFRIIGMTAREYVKALLPATGATLAMAVVVIIVRESLPAGWTPLPRLLVQVLAGAAVYTGIIYTIHGERLRALHSLLKGVTPQPGGSELIHETPDSGAGDRLILISYHFPPDPAIGALRWRKLARFAAERGWGLDIITRDRPSIPGADPSGLADLPAGVRVFGVPPNPPPIERPVNAMWDALRSITRRPGEGRSAMQDAPLPRAESRPRDSMRWLPREPRDFSRAYFAAIEHSRYRRWSADAARLALRLYDPQRHRAVITCGPPHPVHEAGVIVSRRTRLPLVIDLRDPWSLVQRLPEAIASGVGIGLAQRDERRAVQSAALVVANTHALRNAMRRLYPEVGPRIIAVPNGFDDDPVPAPRRARKFTIVYAGTIYLDRDPRGLFTGVARLIHDLNLNPSDIGIEFMGDAATYDRVPLQAIAKEEGIADYVTLRPVGTRQQAMEFLAGGSMLVVLPQDSDMAIPAKVFDYARFSAWMLVFAERGSATDLMLQGTTADLVRPGDLDGLTEILRARYLQHLRGEIGTPVAQDERLSRSRQAKVLFDALEGIVGAPRRPRTETTVFTPALSQLAS